ncbi:hypothetical protein R6Q59_019997 [Mikania micrantha]
MAKISDANTIAALDALLKWKNKQTNSLKPQLLPQDEFIYIVLTLKKIPQKGAINGARTNPYKIPLPHPIISPNVSEICLIIDDRPNSKLTSEIAKKKIKSDGIPVTKVIKLSKLRTDYKPHEAKRKLCDSYDMFFADKRVIPLLPKLLGKQFFRKKNLPLGVDLSHKNWKEQIERGCCCGLLFFGNGTCSVIRVAKASMERDEIFENLRAAIDGGVEFIPKKWSGVRSLHLKFSDSVALPLYQSLPDIKLKIEGIQEKNVDSVEEVIKVEEVAKKKRSKKSRIHEIDHELENSDLTGSKLIEDDGGLDKKKRKGDEVEMGKKKRSKKGKIHEVGNDLDADESLIEAKTSKSSVKEKKMKRKVDEHDAKKPSDQVAKNKGKIHEVSDDLDTDEVLIEAKPVKKSVKQKKKKGNAVEEHDVSPIPSDQLTNKKGKKQNGDSGKKEKKKGRLVSKV